MDPRNHNIESFDVTHLTEAQAARLHVILTSLEVSLEANENYLKKNTLYRFKEDNKFKMVRFSQTLTAYPKAKKSPTDKTEFIYSVEMPDGELGKGGNGQLNKAMGKLVHENNKMIYVSQAQPKLMTKKIGLVFVADDAMQKENLNALSQNEIPLIIQTNSGIKLYVRGEHNEWKLISVDPVFFKGVKFPVSKGDIEYLSSADLPVEAQKELHKHHRRREKVTKAIPLKKEKKTQLRAAVQEESEIGRLFYKGTKEAAFVQLDNVEKGMLVMDLVPGQTLREMMKNVRLTREQKITLSINLAKALIAFHATGYLHSDIKPENIMADQNLQVRLIDFGSSSKINAGNAHAGTTFYVSPERVIDSRNAGTQSDDYAMVRTIRELWNDAILEDEWTSFNEHSWIMKLGEEFDSPPKNPKIELDATLPERISDPLSRVLLAGSHALPESRKLMKDVLFDLEAIQKINYDFQSKVDDTFQAMVQLLGDKRNGDATKKSINNFTLEKLEENVSRLQLPPHMILNFYQLLFDKILQNKNHLYTHTGSSLNYTHTQLSHIEVLKKAYCRYVQSLTLSDMSKQGLLILQKKLMHDQDAKQNPLNINNFNTNTVHRILTSAKFEIAVFFLKKSI